MYTVLINKIFIFFSFFYVIHSADIDCCKKLEGRCRSICESVQLESENASFPSKQENLELLKIHCSVDEPEFWNCLYQKDKQDKWYGSSCCHLSQSPRCKQTCFTSVNGRDLNLSCRFTEEPDLSDCLHNQQIGEKCCSNADTVECKISCKEMFNNIWSPTIEVREAVNKHCSTKSTVMNCISNHTREIPVPNSYKYLHCCEKSDREQCKESCKKSLRIGTMEVEIINALQDGGCGPPKLQDPLWQCFLQGIDANSMSTNEVSSSRIHKIGIDSAKLHCCSRASSSVCRKLCNRAFSNEWSGYIDTFNKECLSYQAGESLRYCLDEVEEPCKLGCDGMSFCTNFNNRPTELFRGCNTDADNTARNDVALWMSEGYISAYDYKIPLRNISSCDLHVWKAIACMMEMKPCHKVSHSTFICREDCYNLLTKCLDWEKIPDEITAYTLCTRFSFDATDSQCISTDRFLKSNSNIQSVSHPVITAPCNGDPCNSNNHICLINRHCQTQGSQSSCPSYRCVKGCTLGEMSRFLVPMGAYVRLPSTNYHNGCYKLCQCNENGILDNCRDMQCVPLNNCWISGRKFEHGSVFNLDCNLCNCYAGEVICTRKPCVTMDTKRNDVIKALPCNCIAHHVPVCGSNGKTYYNSCLAKCAGLTDADLMFGQCWARNPCDVKVCPAGEICVPRRKVCLSLLHIPCRQFQCVNIKKSCENMPSNPVCDTDGKTHDNVCHLLKRGKTLAYNAPCSKNCDNTGPVCGSDGNTYASECIAHSFLVNVDYTGPCSAIGYTGNTPTEQCSTEMIKCKPLSLPGCQSITPPGACCPVCAGAFRALYSQKQVDRTLHTLGENITDALTVEAVLKSLDRHIQISECEIRGHITIESDLLVLVVATSKNPTKLQLDVCVSEAEKLATMIRKSSPRINSELSLSILTTATIATSIPFTQSFSCKIQSVLFIIVFSNLVATTNWI